VVLEAPAFGMSAAWTRVQPPVGLLTRVCSYDRAGLGWSEAGDAAYDPGAVPGQLHTLLRGSNERGPFVLVGQGLGAEFVRLFAVTFPHDTAALVLVDDPVASGPDSNNASWLVNASMAGPSQPPRRACSRAARMGCRAKAAEPCAFLTGPIT
jgi:pimeloyl-ACP methyl ester carboxylesterase